MALLSKKENTEEKTSTEAKTSAKNQKSTMTGVLIMPKLSEKSVKISSLNQYIFKVSPKANKLQIKKALESFYGIKIVKINVSNSLGKKRNYGRTSGTMSDFKKAIVTLSKDSKKPSFVTE